MTAKLSALADKVMAGLRDKKRWHRYRGRTEALPAPYREAVRALDRYLTYFGALARGDVMMTMLEDLAELFEQAAADATPIRAVVGDDPVEFAEDFLRNYSEGQWIQQERIRLTTTIDRLVAEEPR